MVLLDGDTSFSRESLKPLNCVQHPLWVFDVERMEMYWANLAGLVVWNAASLEELLARDFKGDVREATRIRMLARLELFKRGGRVQEQHTAYPNGEFLFAL